MASQSLEASLGPTSPPPPAPAALIVSPPPPHVANGPISPPVAPSRNSTTLVALCVGIGIGGAIVLVGFCIFMYWYRRRKRRHGLLGLSVPPSSLKPKDDPFGGARQHWQQSAPPQTDNMVSMLPKPSLPPSSASNSQQLLVGVHTSPPPPSFSSSSGSEKLVLQPSPVSFSQVIFSYQELEQATDGFSEGNLLGQGGFGYVHKGVLPDGKEIAVKQLKIGSGQGEREFRAEVEIIGRVQHRHLVSLAGYCCSGAQRLLVYEFVPNKTLEFHLHGQGQLLNWANRMKIALGSAKGLAYLHEDCHPKIIHRDIKASNILLDHTFEAKVADFGLARLIFETDTHISTRVMGTFGYLAPEYALTGKLTDKSDVFSFGVMLLELITGRRPIDKAELYLDDNIVDWARPLLNRALEDGNFDSLVDARLLKNYDSTEMARMVACAAVCVRHLARLRPRMSQVVRALEGNISLDELNDGCKPGHSIILDSFGSSESDYGNSQYKENLKKFRKMAFETLSSECSGPTSEFAVHISGSCSGPTSEFAVHISGSSSEELQTT